MLRYFILLVALLFLPAAVGVRAQYDPSFSHYWAMPTAYNPAAVGKQEKINVAAAYNMSMTGFKRNPHTMYVSGDLPFYALGSYHGVGLQLVSDQLGLFSHNRLSLQYAWKHRLLGGTVSVGLQAGMLSEQFDGSKLDLEEAGDPAFSSSSITGSGVDLGAGVYYQRAFSRGSLYAGAAALHLNQPTVNLGETNELSIGASYFLTAGGNIRLRNPFLSLQPSLFGRYDGAGYRADATCIVQYEHEQRRLYAGLGYSPTNSVSVYIGGLFHGITLGYSYEMYTSAITPANGSHELNVGYQTDLNLFKKGRNRHQSVRML